MGLEGPVYQYYCRVKRQLKDLDIRIFGEQGWAEIGKVIAESGIETDGEVHAGGVETSMALASRPELVHLDRLARPKKQGRSWSSSWWIMEELSDTGATGNPMVYDLELGKRITERMAQVFADFLGEMWRTRPVPVHKGSVG
jgi:creatinine amidohydrolase